MTSEQIEELTALKMANDATKGAAFQHMANYDFYKPLADAELVEIGPPPGRFDPAKFFGVTITQKGRQALSS